MRSEGAGHDDSKEGENPPPPLPPVALAELERWLRELRQMELEGWDLFIPGGWRRPS